MSSSPPQAVIIAGPNGSGKSTAAAKLLSPDMAFVNADMIAAEISGKAGTPADVGAGRLLLERVDGLQQNRQDFAFETTLATVMLVNRIDSWCKSGYDVRLIFFWLPSDDLAVERVASRVRAGGHGVPEDTIRRRYRSGVRNFFQTYRSLVDTWRVYDNSGSRPLLVAKGAKSDTETVKDPELWNQMCAAYDK